MSVTPRDKFLKQLRKTMNTSTSATERTAATKLYAEMTFGLPANGTGTGDISLPEFPVTLQRAPSEYDETVAQSLREHRDNGLFTLLMLLKPPVFMQGLWGDTPEGWTNARDGGKLMTFDDARVLISNRIVELNLDSEKVYAYPKSHSSLAEHMAFLQADFDDQMKQFRLQHEEGKTNGN